MNAANPVTILDSHLVNLTSNTINQAFTLSIQLPRSYGDSVNAYPVLYLLDADQFFGLTTDTARLLYHRDGVPELIIVGIGYGSDVSAHFNERMRDLSPSAIEQFPTSGGGSAFLQFLAEDVIPYIDSHYRSDPRDRALVGVSISGLFALYTMFQRPTLFSRYLISSPSVSWDDEIIFDYEEKAMKQSVSPTGRLFLSVGSLENQTTMVKPLLALVEQMTNRDREDLQITSTIIPGETHFSVHPAAIARGLKVIFGDREGEP